MYLHKELKKIKDDALIAEAYLTALFWNDPENYNLFDEESINASHFLNNVWSFYFSLGRKMSDKGIKIYDSVSVLKAIKEFGLTKDFEKYGEYETIDEVREVVQGFENNLDSYFEEIKKNNAIKNLVHLFGNKVVEKKGKYDYKKMTKDQLITYWSDKVNNISFDGSNRYDEYNLIGDPEIYIKQIEEQADTGLPLYKSKMLNGITNGVHKGHIVMFGAFGNAGKTSFVFSKYVMSHIINREKLVVIANEEEIKAFRDKLVISMLSGELKTGINRKKLNQANLSDEDKNKIRMAFNKAKELEGEDSIIKFVFMEDYIMNDVKKLIKYYHNRGFESFLIDTHKVSEHSEHRDRWVTFVEDMKQLYKLTRNNANGMNLRMWVNFQLADHAIKNRYLDFDAIGEGKAAKNEASVVQMMRTVWADEYEGAKNELDCFKFVPDEFNGGYREDRFKLKRGKVYYLLFNPKNRFGSNTDTGQPVLILEPNFNNNVWKEVGWCIVANDKNR